MEIARKNHKSVNKKIGSKVFQIEKDVPAWLDKNIEASSASDEERKAIEEMLKEYR